jgi:hypothetical protein
LPGVNHAEAETPTIRKHALGSDNISLNAELIRAVKNWPVLTTSKDGNILACPIHFSDDEVEQCLCIEAEQNHIDVQMEKIRDRLGVGTDGWTPHGRHKDAREEN